MLLAACFHLGKFSPDDQILDRDFALDFFIGALDNDAGLLRRSAYFICGPNCRSRDKARRGCRHCAAPPPWPDNRRYVKIKHGDDDRAAFGFQVDFPRCQRGKKARYADGKTGRRHRLAAKAQDEAIVTPTAADRTEARRAVLAVGREGTKSTSKTGPV